MNSVYWDFVLRLQVQGRVAASGKNPPRPLTSRCTQKVHPKGERRGSAAVPAPGPPCRGPAMRRGHFSLLCRGLERRAPDRGRRRQETAGPAHLGPSAPSMNPEPSPPPGLREGSRRRSHSGRPRLQSAHWLLPTPCPAPSG